METRISGSPQDEQQFWHELEIVVKTKCESTHKTDVILKTYFALIESFADKYLPTEYDWEKCAWLLLESPLFSKRKSHVRRRMFGRLRKEHENNRIHIVANILLLEGRESSDVFKAMVEDGLFSRLVDLVRTKRDEDRLLWGNLLDLMYEMSRIQKLETKELTAIDDDFVKYLFSIVEEDPYDYEDPYHYPIIRMLLVLNEQYMLHASSDHGNSGTFSPPTNKILKTLSYHGPTYKTFGENLVLLINREVEVSLQLLILKVLYLIFTTSATYEYFYTNDLRVLVDVIIRNLLDLPEESQNLRWTYLRVLYPLLSHSQLNVPPHYKRGEILNMLAILSNANSDHFGPADPTTLRLVSRCMTVPWLKVDPEASPENPAQRLLGITLAHHGESSVSLMEVTGQTEKPGVMMPSKRDRNMTNGVEITGEA